ncbi:hypothetical protein [Pengzhenrongella frigida]|uniref:Conjugal transfer protein n=1 Tax=Pengzhenrongella frigida TaxID=1259133 RepID=A0A4Q5N317_9MICO|nr:hypothetical protein [Cellulomonas sp. HLT2-17]RYV50997.1 hypothetical protein EUA98_10845 [Cellulomonas sp. HLT2-17]
MQRSRRTTPYPFTWEIPVGTLLAVLLAVILGLQTGRSLANLVAGNGWVFVDRVALFTTLGPLLGGHAEAGLPAAIRPASVEVLWTCVGIVELLVLVAIGWAVKFGLDRWGPARLRGMATAAQAEALLGRTRLRHHAKVIRPDLYGAHQGGRR